MHMHKEVFRISQFDPEAHSISSDFGKWIVLSIFQYLLHLINVQINKGNFADILLKKT